MKWFVRTICGNKYHEYMNHKEDYGHTLFSIEQTLSGHITLYDLDRDMGVKHYNFSTLKEAKKIAVLSIEDKTILTPYFDQEWEDFTQRSTKVIHDAKKLIAQLKKEKNT